MNNQQMDYASKKININGVMYHPELAAEKIGWRYQASHAIHCFGENKDFAIRSMEHHKTFTKVGKLRYGTRRIINSSYGFQRRYQISVSHESFDINGNKIQLVGPYNSDAELENFNMEMFN